MAPAAPFCAVIGAGPAGLIAADVLAHAGARVSIYEGKPTVARKFLMAGRGGLNVTHSEDLEVFLTRYGDASERLAPHIRAFPPQRLRESLRGTWRRLVHRLERPRLSEKLQGVAFVARAACRLRQHGVSVETRTTFEGFKNERDLVLRNAQGEREIVKCDAVVLALGGASWPRFGSNAAWVPLLAELGVAVTPLAPANCGALIDWSERFRDAFEGQPLKTIALCHGDETARGDVVITKTGLEGGPAYALSSSLRRAIQQDGVATLHVDMRPDTTLDALAQKLSRARGKQSLSSFLRKSAGLSKLEIALLREIRRNDFPSEALALATLIKDAPIAVRATAGFERAISTSGGVAFGNSTTISCSGNCRACSSQARCWISTRQRAAISCKRRFRPDYAAGRGAARYVGLTPDD